MSGVVGSVDGKQPSLVYDRERLKTANDFSECPHPGRPHLTSRPFAIRLERAQIDPSQLTHTCPLRDNDKPPSRCSDSLTDQMHGSEQGHDRAHNSLAVFVGPRSLTREARIARPDQTEMTQ